MYTRHMAAPSPVARLPDCLAATPPQTLNSINQFLTFFNDKSRKQTNFLVFRE
jgi:hypothetical protein